MMRDGIVKRGSKWAYKLELPPDPATGRRRQKWVSGFRTRKEAQAARDDARAGLRVGNYVPASRQTVGEYLAEWLAGVRAEYAPGTWDAAKLHVDTYIVPRVGAVPLSGLTTPIVKALYADLAESGRAWKRCAGCGAGVGRAAELRRCPTRGCGGERFVSSGLSSKTVHNVHRTLSRALNDAAAERPPRIPANPAAKAHRQPPSPEQATWTSAQLRTFYGHVSEDRLVALWRLAANTGLRRGELVGLRWPDVDLDGGRLAVANQRAKGGGAVHSARPKGKRGRSVALDPVTVAVLRAHRLRQMEERMHWGPAWQDTGLVFTHPDGAPLHPDTVTKRLRRLVRAAGLPWVKLHGLRHTHATLMLDNRA